MSQSWKGFGFITQRKSNYSKSLINQVQGDLTGIIVTIENDYKLV